MKHTPGPWINHGRIPQNGGLPHSSVGAKTLLARVYSEAYGDIKQEAANARLIAAAPDLLEALNAMLTHMGMDEDEWSKPTFEQARAAIAKARGTP